MAHHSRIYPANYLLVRELPADHPTIRALQIHAEARDSCVGKEIDWPHLGLKAIDQVWFSDIDFKEWRFSSFAYQYISYDLILDGWIESAPEPTEAELGFLEDMPKMRQLLDECEKAAREEKNAPILPMVTKAREFVDSLEKAIRFRFQEFGITCEL